MISANEYEIFQIIKAERYDDLHDDYTVSKMIEEGLLEYTGAKIISISKDGERAFEEYQNFLEQEQREKYNLQLSEEANTKASRANILSIIAIVVPSVFSIASLVLSILSYLNN